MTMAHDDVRIYGHKVIGTYSTNQEENYMNDSTNRRFYLAPGDSFKLSYGEEFKKFTDKKGESNLVGGRYRWMEDHRQDLIDNQILDIEQSRLNVDFVSHRGVLSSILQMGGKKVSEIDLAVTLYKGTYHLRTKGLGRADPQAQDIQKIAASSKILLQFVTSKDGRTPDEPSQDEPTFAKGNEYFYTLMTVNCGNHRLLLSGDIQAEKRIAPDEPPPALPDPSNCMNVRSRETHQNIKPMKALGWWAPNVIAGIPEICCGLRNDKQNTIKKIETIKTYDLATSGYTEGLWDPEICIQTMKSVLSKIKELVQEDNPGSIKQTVLIIRSVDDGPEVKQTFDIRGRLEEDHFVEEHEIRRIYEGNE